MSSQPTKSSIRDLAWKFRLRFDRAERDVRRIKVARRFFLSYVVVLLVPILLSLAIYRESYVLAERQAQGELEASMSRTSEFLTLRFQEVRRLLGLLDSNAALRRMAYSSNSDIESDYFRLISLRNNLFPYSRVSDLINGYVVAFSQHDHVVTPTIAGRLNHLYDDWFTGAHEDYAAFREWLFGQHHQGTIVPVARPTVFGSPDTELVYVEALQAGLGALTVVLVVLDTAALMDALNLGTEGAVRGMALYDATGDMLVGVGDVEPGAGSVVLEREIPRHPLVVRGSYRVGSLGSYTRRVTLLIVGSVLMSAVIGVALARYLSRAQSRPLVSLLQQLGRTGRAGESSSLTDAVQAIVTSHKRLERSIERQRPVVQAAVLGKLVRGEYHSAEALNRAMSLAGIPTPSGAAAVFMVSSRFAGGYISSDNDIIRESEAVGSVIRDVLLDYDTMWAYVVDDRVSAVVSFSHLTNPDEAFPLLRQRATQVVQQLDTDGGMDALVCMGPVVSDLLDLPRSYDEATHLHERESAAGRSGLFTVREDSLGLRPVTIDFPVSLENRITASIKGGSGAMAAGEIREILDGNTPSEVAGGAVAATLRSQVLGMLYRVARALSPEESFRVEQALEEVARLNMSRSDSSEALITVAVELAELYARKKRSHNEILLESMKRVVGENLSNPDLSLAMIADQCAVSEVYASQFFKEQAGEQFSHYVEMRRMQLARELLSDHRIQVKEVSSAVGFRNVNSFTRAFKRSTRFTPTEYRSLS